MTKENGVNLKKIIVESETELTDILRALNATDASRILLTFTEPNDLLISPINLKVIREACDDKDRTLVAQIINNPAGVRNAQDAQIITTDSANAVDEDLWIAALDFMEQRRRSKKDSLKKSLHDGANSAAHGPLPKTKVDEKEQKLTVDEMVTNEKTAEDTKDFVIEDRSNSPEISATEQVQATDPTSQAKEKSEFARRIESALSKSRQTIAQGNAKSIRAGSIEIALDQDIKELHKDDSMYSVASNGISATGDDGKSMLQKSDIRTPSLVGRSIANPSFTSLKDEAENKGPRRSMGGNFGGKMGGLKSITPIFTNGLSSIGKGLKKGNWKRSLLLISIPLLFLTAVVLWLVYIFAPLVTLNLYIASKAVAVEREFTGDPSTTVFDLDANKVRVKKETFEQELSDNGTATTKAFKGEKAGGPVTIKCLKFSGSVAVPAGTVLTSGGLNYTTVSDINVPCPGFLSVTVQASAVGEEYNLPSGSLFTVQGFASTDVAGVNDQNSLSGGSKEEYVVIGQGDVDKVVEALKTSGFADGTSELKDRAADGWVLIDSTIKNEAGDKPTTDKPVGAEADIFNLTLKITSSAMYYNEKDLLEIADSLVLEEAKKVKLFEGDDDLKLKLDTDIVREITVKNVDNGIATVVLKVSGAVIPDIDDNKIVNDLRGKSWKDGIKYLNDLKFVAKDTELKFTPGWFPDFWQHFPSRQGRIILKVKKVEVETPAPVVTPPAEAPAN